MPPLPHRSLSHYGSTVITPPELYTVNELPHSALIEYELPSLKMIRRLQPFEPEGFPQFLSHRCWVGFTDCQQSPEYWRSAMDEEGHDWTTRRVSSVVEDRSLIGESDRERGAKRPNNTRKNVDA